MVLEAVILNLRRNMTNNCYKHQFSHSEKCKWFNVNANVTLLCKYTSILTSSCKTFTPKGGNNIFVALRTCYFCVCVREQTFKEV